MRKIERITTLRMRQITNPIQNARVLSAVSLALILAACSSAPVEESSYRLVESSIDDAKKIKAKEYAGGELFAAQKKLEEARQADKTGDREKALRLLKESELHAELAESRAMTARSQESLDEVNAGLSTLEKELGR